MVAQLAPPPTEPRPARLDKAVVTRAAAPCLAPLVEALGKLRPTTEVEVNLQVVNAIVRSGGESWRAARLLEDDYLWPVDLIIAKIVGQIVGNLSPAHGAETGLWCLRNGYKFPARCDDTVEWIEPDGQQRAGRVITLDRPRAAAICQLILAGQPAFDHYRVHAENVFANVSQGLYCMGAQAPGVMIPPVDKVERPKHRPLSLTKDGDIA